MNPKVAELIAALPPELQSPTASGDDLGSLLARLARRPVPVHRVSRLWALGSLEAKVAAAYLAWWLRNTFADADDRERRLHETHVRAALKVLSGMSYLRGTLMKMGQTLAHWPSVAPAEFVQALSMLHFEAPPMHFSLLREQLHNELGGDPEELFAEFETEAFAAASLGQVHRARLHSGETVAVKIQYPNIARAIAADFKNLSTVTTPLRLTKDWDSIQAQFEDMRTMLDLELDYVHEAAMMKEAHALFADDPDVVVPRVYERYSTGRILTADLIVGEHPPQFVERGPNAAERDRRGEQILRTNLRLFQAGRVVYADPHPGNYLMLEDGRIGLLDFGCCRRLEGDDWEYCILAERASTSGDLGELDELTAQGCDVPEVGHLSEGNRLAVHDFARWVWEPLVYEGPFDFGDAHYFERGAQLLGNVLRKRYMRSKPLNTWLNRNFFGVRALLHQLGARVDMRRINAEESARAAG